MIFGALARYMAAVRMKGFASAMKALEDLRVSSATLSILGKDAAASATLMLPATAAALVRRTESACASPHSVERPAASVSPTCTARIARKGVTQEMCVKGALASGTGPASAFQILTGHHQSFYLACAIWRGYPAPHVQRL